jgi:hypothetical protein
LLKTPALINLLSHDTHHTYTPDIKRKEFLITLYASQLNPLWSFDDPKISNPRPPQLCLGQPLISRAGLLILGNAPLPSSVSYSMFKK